MLHCIAVLSCTACPLGRTIHSRVFHPRAVSFTYAIYSVLRILVPKAARFHLEKLLCLISYETEVHIVRNISSFIKSEASFYL